MAFTNNDYSAKVYAPGYFLAENENCERKTRQADSTDQRVITTGSGGKYLPMGTVYPSDDANAEGILYEDTDVTYGDMPCSVVLRGTVYENRLPVTGADYDAADIGDYVSPAAQGWYESDGQVTPTYTLSTDTEADSTKTYYTKSGATYSAVTVGDFVSPADIGLYESDGQSPATYTLSTDTTADSTKTYYTKTDIRISSAAKSALESKGIRFVTEPAVVRP